MNSKKIETKDFSAAVYALEAEAKRRDARIYARFKEPPWYMQFLPSWTTGREEYEEWNLSTKN